jgi:hypothetical protein
MCKEKLCLEFTAIKGGKKRGGRHVATPHPPAFGLIYEGAIGQPR